MIWPEIAIIDTHISVPMPTMQVSYITGAMVRLSPQDDDKCCFQSHHGISNLLVHRGRIGTSVHEGVLYNQAASYLSMGHTTCLYRVDEIHSAKCIGEARLQRPGASRSTVASTTGQHISYRSSTGHLGVSSHMHADWMIWPEMAITDAHLSVPMPTKCAALMQHWRHGTYKTTLLQLQLLS